MRSFNKLREADLGVAQGKPTAEIYKQLGVTDNTYFRWRKSHGGPRIDQAQRIAALECVERECGYRDRQILIAYVTADKALRSFWVSVFPESSMLIYRSIAEARRGISSALADGRPLDVAG